MIKKVTGSYRDVLRDSMDTEYSDVINSVSVSRSVVADSLRPLGLQPTRFHCPEDFPDKDTGVGCHFLLPCMKVKSESEVPQSRPTLR